eukprot:6196172-Pleurochrysis_carterae.AAC.2
MSQHIMRTERSVGSFRMVGKCLVSCPCTCDASEAYQPGRSGCRYAAWRRSSAAFARRRHRASDRNCSVLHIEAVGTRD